MKKTDSLIFNEKLLKHTLSNLGQFKTHRHEHRGSKKAAVAITVVNVSDDPGVYGLTGNEHRHNDAALILTRRAHALRNHSGQWAFPGGKMDRGERPEDTALRELAEEVGLSLTHDRVLGRLDDFTTRSGYTITPVVVWGGTDVVLEPNPAEVEFIHRIPIEEFLRKDAPIIEQMEGSKNPVLLMPVGNSWIAAPTAAMIYQFREVVILGRETRVDHYEQPLFAWK
jgi:8-oxo-dGTP pyrophosphatase MutT (NUDIX family)